MGAVILVEILTMFQVLTCAVQGESIEGVAPPAPRLNAKFDTYSSAPSLLKAKLAGNRREPSAGRQVDVPCFGQ